MTEYGSQNQWSWHKNRNMEKCSGHQNGQGFLDKTPKPQEMKVKIDKKIFSTAKEIINRVQK
jgi:hypothetical protein